MWGGDDKVKSEKEVRESGKKRIIELRKKENEGKKVKTGKGLPWTKWEGGSVMLK